MSSTAIDPGAHGLVLPRKRPAIPDAPQSVAGILRPVLATEPTREALVTPTASLTYAHLDDLASRAAAVLIAAGVQPGDRVAASLPNADDIVVAFLGTMRIGAIWLGVNRNLALPEKIFQLDDAGVSLLLTETSTARQVEGSAAKVPSLRRLLIADPGDADSEWATALRTAPTGFQTADPDPFAPAAIGYTSGTTGYPKGAVHSQHNLVLVGVGQRSAGLFSVHTRLGMFFALTQLACMVAGPLAAFGCRGTSVIHDRSDAETIAQNVRAHRIDALALAPTVMHDLTTNLEVSSGDLATVSVAWVGASDPPEAFRVAFREKFGCQPVNAYGLTEGPNGIVSEVPGEEHLPGGTGKAYPTLRVFAVGESGDELPPGEIGELCVGSRRSGLYAYVYTPMLGYWNRPEETATALAGGHLHTGDVGYVDLAGNVFIKDRLKEVIIRGGANVYPAEVERVMYEHPAVGVCGVVGKADKRLGHRIVAVVQLKEGAAVSEMELRDHCLKNLAPYKTPEVFVFVDSIPHNAMGKVNRRDLPRYVEDVQLPDRSRR